jgi:hypothetical protein
VATSVAQLPVPPGAVSHLDEIEVIDTRLRRLLLIAAFTPEIFLETLKEKKAAN